MLIEFIYLFLCFDNYSVHSFHVNNSVYNKVVYLFIYLFKKERNSLKLGKHILQEEANSMVICFIGRQLCNVRTPQVTNDFGQTCLQSPNPAVFAGEFF